MVEKSKLPAGLKSKQDGVETKRPSGGGILKRSGKNLDSVPEFGETQIQRTDSTLDSAEKPQTPNEEQKKFHTLCGGVQNTMALFQISMAELLALKDELIKHSLPPSLLVKITLVTSKLFRGASDLSVPINELVRLVKLYSAPWETKSAALKKLHEDYENKQRQLNVALQKLVLVGIQSERMSQERRVLNWERLFSRMMTSKAHGYRWKFLIESFKKKVKTGEVYEAGTSTDTDVEKENVQKAKKLESVRRKTLHRDTAAKRIMRESVSIQSARDSLASPITSVQTHKEREEDKESAISDEEALIDLEDILKAFDEEDNGVQGLESPNRQPRFSLSPKQSHRPSPAKESPRPRIRFMAASDDDEDEEEEETKSSVVKFMPQKKPSNRSRIQFTEEKPKTMFKKPIKSRGVRFFSPSDDEDEEEEETKEDPPKATEPEKRKVLTEDKECWTHEPDYDRSLHLRIFRPICKKAEAPCCSIVFNDQVMKTESYPPPEPPPEPTEPVEPTKTVKKPTDSKVKPKGKAGSARKNPKGAVTPTPPSTEKTPEPEIEIPPPRFEELVFKLPEDTGYSPGQTPVNLNDAQMKISIHPAPNVPMIAMAAIKYGDIKLVDPFEGKWSHTEYAQHLQDFPVMSAVSDREMPFGTICGSIPIVCYLSTTERPKILAKATETPTFEELVQSEIEERRKIEEAERQAAMEGIAQPVYTEEDMETVKDTHTQELQAMQEEYEKRLNELAQGLSAYSGDDEGLREFVHAATSPVFMRSPSPLRAHSGDQIHPPRPPSDAAARSSSRRTRPRMANLPEWGKDLPEDFMVRLDMFSENSERYRQELEEKTKRAIQQKYELQMAVQNRLDKSQDDEEQEEEVCLPAVFMPTRTGVVYSPKAHSYFHPPGSSEGRLTQPPSMFKLPHLGAANHVAVLNLFDMGERIHTSGTQGLVPEPHYHQGVPHVPQTAPPPPTAFDMRSSPPSYPGRSCTR